MIAALLAVLAAGPAWLHDDQPDSVLRYRTVPVTPTATAGAWSATFALPGAPTLRFDAAGGEACTPALAARFATPQGAWLERPLPVQRQGAFCWVSVPPSVNPGLAEERAISFTLSLPAGCPPARVSLVELARDDYALARVADEVRRLAEQGAPPELLPELGAGLPLRWQQALAGALLAAEHLARLPGSEEALRLFRRWQLEAALDDARAADATFFVPSALPAAGAALAVGDGAPTPWTRLAAGAQVEVAVEGEEALRVFVRGLAPGQDPGLQALELRLDGAPAQRWPLVLAHADPEHPAFSRVRSLTVPLPGGSRRATLVALHGDLALRGFTLHHKPHLQDALTVRATGDWLHLAARLEGAAPRDRLVRALARAALAGEAVGAEAFFGVDDLPLRAFAEASWPGREGALARLTAARAWLAGAEPAFGARLDAALTRAQVRLLGLEGRWAEAAQALLALGARQPLSTDDAVALASVETASGEALERSSRALALLDVLVGERPLDRELLAARDRLYHDATGWQAMSGEADAEVAWLEPRDAAAPAAGERSSFVQLGDAEVSVQVPAPRLPRHRPVLTVLVLRPGGVARVVDAELDGQPLRLPCLAERSRFDLPVSPAAHRLRLAGAELAGQVWVSHGRGAAAWSLRRYGAYPAGAARFQAGEAGVPALVRLTLRLAGDGAAPLPDLVPLRVEAEGAPPLLLTLHPVKDGAAPVEGRAPGLVSAPAEVVVPVPFAGAEVSLSAALPPGFSLLARAGVRHRQPLATAASSQALALSAPEFHPEDALARLQALAAGQEAVGAAVRLERAALLAELDEVALAREELLGALEAPLGPNQRGWALQLWHGLDEVGGASPASVPDSVEQLTPELALPGAGAPGPRLLALLDDPAALDAATPAELLARAGEADVDLALLLAARRADGPRAAALWEALAQRQPTSALFQREAGRAWLAAAVPGAGPHAFLRLAEATRLAPRDASAHRLLRRARGATDAHALLLAESSAGTVRARVSASPGRRPTTVEEALLPPRAGAQVTLGGARWTTELALAAPAQLQLDAAPRELRPHQAALSPAPPVALELALDDAVRLVACAERCTATLTVSAGTHRLAASWKGGVRPAGRLSISGGPGEEERRQEYLVARSDAPLVLRVSGPAMVGLELRTRLDRQRADGVTVEGAVSAAPALDATPDPLARLEGGTPLTVAGLVQLAVGPGDGRLVVRPAHGELLVRPSVRQDRDRGPPEPRAAAARLGYRVPFEPRPEAPPSLVAGEVQPGLEALGEVEAGAEVRRTVLNGLGVDVQPTTQGIAAVTYRRLAEPLHTAFKVGAEGRFAAGMAPTAWLGAELFFLHPAFRFLRLQLTADGWTQAVAGQQALAARLGLLLEVVAPLRPGLSFVGKAMGWLSGRTLRDLADAQLTQVDPDVFSRYELSHPRGLYLEAGLQWMPFANLVLYGNARLTTNPSFSPLDQDHLSVTALARAVFGRTYVQAQLRGSWFFVDAARPDPVFHPLAQVSVFQTFWLGERNRLEVGGWVLSRLDASFNPAFSLYVAWAFSNGRRFEDHTPLEGEDAFFPQRGPDRERAHLGAPLER